MLSKRSIPAFHKHQQFIRNFAILAHIDHGKTTLTDRLLKITKTVPPTSMEERILDTNPIEKERGITIKLAPVTMKFSLNSQEYTLNLIDTPGHVDFSYEVSRSLAACEGAVLLVDATKGVQAQTVANAQKALNLGLHVLPVINKIDLASADIKATAEQLEQMFGFAKNDIKTLSAKTGVGVEQLIKRIVEELPHPQGKENQITRALVFNSIYDLHLGVIVFIRVMDGQIAQDAILYSLVGKTIMKIKEIGIFVPQRTPLNGLHTGEVGYIATGLKDIRALKVGDTLTAAEQHKERVTPLPGFKLPKPVVFADVYPGLNTDFQNLKEALEKLQLTDAALLAKQIHSPAMGAGFRLGFLGIFHAEITKERLKREQHIETVFTKPTAAYNVKLKNGELLSIQHPSDLPESSQTNTIFEPVVEATVFVPRKFVGSVMQLFQERRGKYKDTQYFGDQTRIIYLLPLAEMISGFVDQLKSVSQGFASLDYHQVDAQPVDAVKLSVRINNREIETLGRIVVRQDAQTISREIVTKIKELLPQQLFAIPIQATIGGKIIARETKPAARKDVTAKLYGGDRTRRMKLLEKQKRGKKKLAAQSQVQLPSSVFSQLMKI